MLCHIPVSYTHLDVYKRQVQGDLGESYYSNQPVTSLIAERMGASLLLSGTSAILAFVIGTLLGLAAGKKENRWQDKVLSAGTYVANAMPSFWLGMMLIFVFASHLGWLPTQGMYTLRAVSYTHLYTWQVLDTHFSVIRYMAPKNVHFPSS